MPRSTIQPTNQPPPNQAPVLSYVASPCQYLPAHLKVHFGHGLGSTHTLEAYLELHLTIFYQAVGGLGLAKISILARSCVMQSCHVKRGF